MYRDQLALQLYTVRDHAKVDLIDTLAEVARIGYRAVEFAGFHGVPVAQIREALMTHNLQVVGAHVPFADFAARPAQVIDDLRAVGCPAAIVPSLPQERRDVGHIGEIAKTFTEWGQQCTDAGLQFAYHNHAYEFELTASSGETFFDLLAAATEPALVAFELDAFWTQYAGSDPIAVLQRYADRIPLLHLKDMDPNDRDADVPFGTGTLPWREILAAAEPAKIAWYIVEQDYPKNPLADVAVSLRNAASMADAR